jgi:DNA-binding NarL/FixJ family response regulator
MTFKVALAEDNPVNTNTFLQKIKVSERLQLVFNVSNGYECIDQLQGLPHNKLPQVVFMDIEMPGMNGIDATRTCKSLYPQIHFIILTVFDDDDKIFEAIRAGASGYLLKHEPASVLQDAVINVIETGGAPMSPAIARKTLNLLNRDLNEVKDASKLTALPAGITEREYEILEHMVNGWDAKRIASELDLSVLTVRKHIANIYDKLHVHSRAQIITLAHKNKWMQ